MTIEGCVATSSVSSSLSPSSSSIATNTKRRRRRRSNGEENDSSSSPFSSPNPTSFTSSSSSSFKRRQHNPSSSSSHLSSSSLSSSPSSCSTSSSSISLEVLPYDILEHIFCYLPFASRLSFRLSSKKCHQLSSLCFTRLSFNSFHCPDLLMALKICSQFPRLKALNLDSFGDLLSAFQHSSSSFEPEEREKTAGEEKKEREKEEEEEEKEEEASIPSFMESLSIKTLRRSVLTSEVASALLRNWGHSLSYFSTFILSQKDLEGLKVLLSKLGTRLRGLVLQSPFLTDQQLSKEVLPLLLPSPSPSSSSPPPPSLGRKGRRILSKEDEEEVGRTKREDPKEEGEGEGTLRFAGTGRLEVLRLRFSQASTLSLPSSLIVFNALSLKEIELHWADVDVSFIALRCPNLRKLHLHSNDSLDISNEDLEALSACTQLKSVNLNGPDDSCLYPTFTLDLGTIEKFASSCRKLKVLMFRLCHNKEVFQVGSTIADILIKNGLTNLEKLDTKFLGSTESLNYFLENGGCSSLKSFRGHVPSTIHAILSSPNSHLLTRLSLSSSLPSSQELEIYSQISKNCPNLLHLSCIFSSSVSLSTSSSWMSLSPSPSFPSFASLSSSSGSLSSPPLSVSTSTFSQVPPLGLIAQGCTKLETLSIAVNGSLRRDLVLSFGFGFQTLKSLYLFKVGSAKILRLLAQHSPLLETLVMRPEKRLTSVSDDIKTLIRSCPHLRALNAHLRIDEETLVGMITGGDTGRGGRRRWMELILHSDTLQSETLFLISKHQPSLLRLGLTCCSPKRAPSEINSLRQGYESILQRCSHLQRLVIPEEFSDELIDTLQESYPQVSLELGEGSPIGSCDQEDDYLEQPEEEDEFGIRVSGELGGEEEEDLLEEDEDEADEEEEDDDDYLEESEEYGEYEEDQHSFESFEVEEEEVEE